MPVCTKCFIDKPQEDYYKEIRWGKTYFKKYCYECFKAQSRAWKERNKERPRKEKIVQPKPPELKPVVFEPLPDTKQCTICGEWKDKLKDFYKTSTKNASSKCRKCYLEHDAIKRNKFRTKELEENGGSKLVRQNPNEYVDEYQRNGVFEILNAMGWVFNEATCIWNKPGVKENGEFLRLKEKPSRKKRNIISKIPKRTSILGKSVEAMYQLKMSGKDYYEIAFEYGCSHMSVRSLIKKYEKGEFL